jgi:hypothetical protein
MNFTATNYKGRIFPISSSTLGSPGKLEAISPFAFNGWARLTLSLHVDVRCVTERVVWVKTHWGLPGLEEPVLSHQMILLKVIRY